MTRSGWFIIVSILLFITVGGIIFLAFGSKNIEGNMKMVKRDKEVIFKAEVLLLDSLYNAYSNALLAGENPVFEAEASSALDNKLDYLRKTYSGSSSPALLAAKLIRNYEARVFLIQKQKQHRKADLKEVTRLREMVKQLEEENLDLKNKNQQYETIYETR